MVLVEATKKQLNIKITGRLSTAAITIVPRVMEKMWQTILDDRNNRVRWEELEHLDELMAEKGRLAGDEAPEYEQLKTDLKFAVKHALGGRIKYITYGGAPMPPRIVDFFRLIGIPLLGTYGSTE